MIFRKLLKTKQIRRQLIKMWLNIKEEKRDREVLGGERCQLLIEWSGKSSVRRWQVSKDWKEVREWTTWTGEGEILGIRNSRYKGRCEGQPAKQCHLHGVSWVEVSRGWDKRVTVLELEAGVLHRALYHCKHFCFYVEWEVKPWSVLNRGEI